MGITDVLCQALQQKSQDILNAMHLVTTTKTLIQKLRDDGWKTLLKEVTLFVSIKTLKFLIWMLVFLVWDDLAVNKNQ